MKDKTKVDKLLKEFEERYQPSNIKLLKGIRILLSMPAGVLLIAGQKEWLEEKLKEIK